MFTNNELIAFSSLYDKKVNDNDEFEAVYKNINITRFNHIKQYLNTIRTNENSKIEYSLDIIIGDERLSIIGLDTINEYYNDLITKSLSRIYTYENSDNIKIIKKIRNSENILDISRYDLRFRLAREDPIQRISGLDVQNQVIRYKQRLSVIIGKSQIDLSITKQSNNIKSIFESNDNYELEIEHKGDKPGEFIKLVTVVKKIIEQSNYIIDNDMKLDISNIYKELLAINNNSLYSMKPISVNESSFKTLLQNKFALCDKADGEKYQLMIHNNNIYVLSNILDVKHTGIVLKSTEFNGSIFDGELILHNGKYIILLYDTLYFKGQNMMNENLYNIRYDHINELMFELGIEIAYKNDIVANIQTYNNLLDDHIGKYDDIFIIRQKYVIFPTGRNDNEIYIYSKVLWDNKGTYKYDLDGLVYTPIHQKYTINKNDINYNILKWKPSRLNTIDFYIKLEKDKNIPTLYFDKVSENNLHFYICDLYVYKYGKDTDIPVKFDTCKLYTDENGYLLDNGERNIIEDDTIVEFYYNEGKWYPLRTRYEKTEFMRLNKRQYGNHEEVAKNIFDTINNPITIDMIWKLGNNLTYNREINTTSNKGKQIYYQKRTDIGVSQRNFHNWIKSNLIYQYCSPKKTNNALIPMAVLDIGCGRGGDISKYYNCNVGLLVGIDPDYNGLYVESDSALNRYLEAKQKFSNYPKMVFINSYGSVKFHYSDQIKEIGLIDDKNKQLIKEFFPDKQNEKPFKPSYMFDVFNCQFSFHYIMANDATLNNFCYNVNTYLKDGGYLIITTFDGKMIYDLLASNSKLTISYTDDQGNKMVFAEIVKKYDNAAKLNSTGLAIDVYLSQFMNSNTYQTEFLVYYDYLIDVMKTACNMDLVETNLFINLYTIYKQFFKLSELETDKKMKALIGETAKFYDDTILNMACLDITKLFRYYVFKKGKSNTEISSTNMALI